MAGHIRVPVEIALDAPGFVVNLAPLLAGIDLSLESTEIQFACTDFGFAGSGVGDAEHGASLIKHLRAVFVEVVAVDALEQHLVFASGDVIDVKHVFWPLIRSAELARFLRRGDVEEFVLASRKAAQNAGLDGDWYHAVGNSIEIDLN